MAHYRSQPTRFTAVGRLKQKCFERAFETVIGRGWCFQLDRQPVPSFRCGFWKSPLAKLAICMQHDVAVGGWALKLSDWTLETVSSDNCWDFLFELLTAVNMCCVQCLKEAVDACRAVHTVLKKRLVTTTSRRLVSAKHCVDVDDKMDTTQHGVSAS